MQTAASLPKSQINAFFKIQRKKSANKRCIDCKAASSVWINLTFSVFICSECAGKHRNLGSEVCKVKSTLHDKWTLDELRRVFVGGNSKVLSHLDFEMPIQTRYKNKAYVKLLNEMVHDVGDEDLFKDETILEDKVFENTEIKEIAIPKFGVVSDEEYCVQEEDERKCGNPVSVKKEAPKQFRIKTNSYSFVKCEAKINEEDSEKNKAMNEGKYSYKNIRSFEAKKEDETSNVKEHVRKAVVTASKCSKKIIGSIINKFKK